MVPRLSSYRSLHSSNELRVKASTRGGASLATAVLLLRINGWGVGTSIFYVAQALAGNMFNTPEDSRLSRWLTLALFLFGSSIYTMALSAFISASLDDAIGRARSAETAADCASFMVWSPRLLIAIMSMLWIGVGALYATFYEGLGLEDALYFALGTFCASGSPPPTCLPRDSPGDCDLGNVRTVFMTVYVCVGVPLFQVLLSSISFKLIQDALARRELEQLVQPLDYQDLQFAMTIHKRGKPYHASAGANKSSCEGKIDLSDFMLMELLRIKRVSMHDVEEIRELFSLIDRNGDGEVDVMELARCKLLPDGASPSALRRLRAYQEPGRRDDQLPQATRSRRTTIN